MKLHQLWQKMRKYELTLPNILSFASLTWMRLFGLALGTVALRLKAPLLGVELGRHVTCHGTVGLMRYPGGRIVLEDNVHIISSWRRATAATLAAPTRLRVFGPNACIHIGEGCELSGAAITARSTTIRLGKNVLVGPNCVITDSDFHAPWPCEERATCAGFERDASVTIEDYCWIGMHSIILKGVHIGRGAIIGAGSVVTRSIPANAVACGVPAKVVRQKA